MMFQHWVVTSFAVATDARAAAVASGIAALATCAAAAAAAAATATAAAAAATAACATASGVAAAAAADAVASAYASVAIDAGDAAIVASIMINPNICLVKKEVWTAWSVLVQSYNICARTILDSPKPVPYPPPSPTPLSVPRSWFASQRLPPSVLVACLFTRQPAVRPLNCRPAC